MKYRRLVPVLSGCICFAVNAANIPPDKEIIRFDSEIGMVNFFHALHATLRTNTCQTCHHTYKEGEAFKTCDSCHPPDKGGAPVIAETPKISKAFHVRCKGCHQYTIRKLHQTAGPVRCKLCHLGKVFAQEPQSHPR